MESSRLSSKARPINCVFQLGVRQTENPHGTEQGDPPSWLKLYRHRLDTWKWGHHFFHQTQKLEWAKSESELHQPFRKLGRNLF